MAGEGAGMAVWTATAGWWIAGAGAAAASHSGPTSVSSRTKLGADNRGDSGANVPADIDRDTGRGDNGEGTDRFGGGVSCDAASSTP